MLPLPPVRHHLLDVESLRVGDRPLGLGQSHQDRSGRLEELGGEVAHVAQPLNHHPLALDPGVSPSAFMSSADAADLTHTEKHAAPRRLDPASDATGAHRLGGDAAERVELAGAELGVGVGDPGHFPRSRCPHRVRVRPAPGR